MCSVAAARIVFPPRPADWAIPFKARLFDSLAEEVNSTSSEATFRRRATDARARSTASRARWPRA